MNFKTIQPQIRYIGTPVALITTTDADGQSNIGPISSAWALGRTLFLGIECGSRTFQNGDKKQGDALRSGLRDQHQAVDTETPAGHLGKGLGFIITAANCDPAFLRNLKKEYDIFKFVKPYGVISTRAFSLVKAHDNLIG